MILHLKYEDIPANANAVRGEVNGKVVNFYFRIKVNPSNIAEAVSRFRGNKYLAALDYEGDLAVLRTLDLSGVPVMVVKEVDSLDDTLDFLFSEVDSHVRVVLKLPSTFTDMQAVYNYSQRYENVRFCGGTLLRLEGCKVGCFGLEDLTKRFSNSRLSVIAEGCGCPVRNVALDEVGLLEFYELPVKVTKRKTESKVVAKSDKEAGSGKPKSAKSRHRFAAFIPVDSIGSTNNF